MNEETSELRKGLGIDDWLELIKEDKNLKGAYICFGQYMDILEKREKQLQNNWKVLKCYLKKQTIELEKVRKDISIDTYIDRKMFLKEVLVKMQELQGDD